MPQTPVSPPRWHTAFAVAGGALFVASLATGVAAYVVDFRAGPNLVGGDATARAIWMDAALFSVFAAHHSVFARTGLKQRMLAIIPQSLERSVYVWIASALFIGLCWFWQPVPGEIWSVGAPVSTLMVAVQLAGVLMTLMASRQLDVLALAGLRQARGEASRATGIVQSGWYGLVRHPIYLGWLLMVWPSPHLTATRAAFAAISSLYLVVAVPIEERALRAQLGDVYGRYAQQVRWRMIPYIY